MKFIAEKLKKIHVWVPDKLYSISITKSFNFEFKPGQFARLGVNIRDNIFRAYSIVSSPEDKYLEFCYNVIPNGILSPCLSTLKIEDNIYIDRISYGFLSIDNLIKNRNLLMIASGTGITPFISLLRSKDIWPIFKKIIIVHSVKYYNELCYKEEILNKMNDRNLYYKIYNNEIVYKPIVTQERFPGITNRRITDIFTIGEIENFLGENIMPTNTSIMICGNPGLVRDMRVILNNIGFKSGKLNNPGNVIFEKYW